MGSLMTLDDSMKEEDSKWPGVPYRGSPGKVPEMRMHEERRERLSRARTGMVLAEETSGKALSWIHLCPARGRGVGGLKGLKGRLARDQRFQSGQQRGDDEKNRKG